MKHFIVCKNVKNFNNIKCLQQTSQLETFVHSVARKDCIVPISVELSKDKYYCYLTF
jgi:hypothetical protein